MIEVSIINTKHKKAILARGHAGLCPGNDVLCASVSTIFYFLQGYQTKLVSLHAGEGTVVFCNNRENGGVLKRVKRFLAELAAQYPSYIIYTYTDSDKKAGTPRAGKLSDPFTLSLFDEGAHQTEGDIGAETTEPESGAPAETGEKEAAFDAGEPQSADFDALIEGPYKEAFHEKVQTILQKRLRDAKQTQARLAEAESVLKLVGDRYGMEDVNETTLREKLASEGTPEEVAALKQQIERMTLEKERSEAVRQAELVYQGWAQEDKTLREMYPDTDFDAAYEDPELQALLSAGVRLTTAFEALHLEEVKEKARESAAASAYEQMRLRYERPQENGAVNGAGVRVIRDVAGLSKRERQEIARRAAQGETIKF